MGPLQEELDIGVAELRQLLSRCSTYSVVGWCFAHLVTNQQDKADTPLASPDRQIAFLLGVLLSSPEPETPIHLDSDAWERVKTLLNQISAAYMHLYIPEEGDREKLTVEWKRVREVAMLTFLHYFNTGLLASVEQMKERIAAYVAPFDDDLMPLIGIGSNDAVAICEFISERLQAQLDRLQSTATKVYSQRQSMPPRAHSEALTRDQLRQMASKEPWANNAAELIQGLQRLGLINLGDIESAFPLTARAFWQRFSVSRGEGPNLKYPTDQSLFDLRPLIRIDDRTAFCITGNSLFFAVLTGGEKALAQSAVKDRFTRARDRSLESEVARYARALLGRDATIWEAVYETPDAQNEHDIVAFDDQLCIIFEAKASPPKEPFRDPDKAFTRIRDAFRSDTGIQKAYEQGNRIVQRLKNGEVVRFFDQDGKEKGSIVQGSRLTVCACITRDDFGPLATNLALLLQKDATDAYPWATNILDLSTIAEAWAYFRWGSKELRTYLEQRLELHGKVFSAYELDYVGCFVRHGGFDSIKRKNAFIQLGTDYSDVFDDIYRHMHASGPPVTIARSDPVLTDLKRSLALGEPVFVPTNVGQRKVGRNDMCPCGSGKKYKKCCGS